ncbi:S-adenosyl-L-methionine-dependent methyltransferase [Phaeosphaeria sp. MPI-PUGE-AT-0046c]|nr:S-adenosyl-L-methionine-dependent methyltransferase [Phaeosphaeria sp. MPI-PUGE-AT-0046c]
MSKYQPYIVSDEDDDSLDFSDNMIDLIDEDSDADSDLELTGSSTKEKVPELFTEPCIKRRHAIKLPDRELKSFELKQGFVVSLGDTVEMGSASTYDGSSMQSGDFLRVKNIIHNVRTDRVRLRGYRLRRNKYLGQLLPWKFNDLAIVLQVTEDEQRYPFIAGLEDIPVEEILRSRECILTNKPYELLNYQTGQQFAFPVSFSQKEVKQQLFHGARLVCRVVNIVITSKNGKAYSGVVRDLYAGEIDSTDTTNKWSGPGHSRHDPLTLDDGRELSKEESVYDPSESLSTPGRRAHTDNVDHRPHKRQSPRMPTRQAQYTFADIFCGIGGASQGAKQAGLSVRWGLDFDEKASQAYSKNHPGALPFQCNAHDFPPRGYTSVRLRVDVLHLSPPCCYFSPAHTHNGPNDQANLEAIYTVGPILQKVKPRVATLEQTFGLYTHEQHKANFYMLLHDISTAGYDLRYKIQDLSQFGLVQPRKRLLIIAARRGTPLPPFPSPTHGPSGSGLKAFQTIHDALIPLERLGLRPTDDQYHQPKNFKELKEPYDPRRFLKGCITTTGSGDYHFSGLRRFTARELGLFQSFPITYKFSGSQSEATKQVGNAFPPVMAGAMYRTITKVLEAFDKGHIDAEDDIDDIDRILEHRGVRLVPPAAPRAVFDVPSPGASNMASRYLVRDQPLGARRLVPTYSSPFARNQPNNVPTSRATAGSATAGSAQQDSSFLNGLLIDLDEFSDDDEVHESIENVIEISSESEQSESEDDEDEDEESGWVHVQT